MNIEPMWVRGTHDRCRWTAVWLSVGVGLASLGCNSSTGDKSKGKGAPAMASAPAPVEPMRATPPVPPPSRAARPVPPPTAGGDFRDAVRQTYDHLFCFGRKPDAGCKALGRAIAGYRRRHLASMQAFLKLHLPKTMPDKVLYPFSGGDLLSAQSVFPGQRRFVLLSLEQGGIPDPLRLLSPARRHHARKRFLRHATRALRLTYSHTKDLLEPEGIRIPGLLALILVGLRVHGGEPTGLRYFKISATGTIDYFDRGELKAAGAWPRPKKRKQWGRIYADPEYNQPYSHLELRYRLPGDTADRVLQHIAADISNEGLGHAPGLEAFLKQLGPRVLMIKAASFLLWKERYARIRELTAQDAPLLLGDTSSPLPEWLRAKGFSLQLFGNFGCPIIKTVKRRARPWIRAFGPTPRPRLPFRYGYGDCKHQHHLILGTRPLPLPLPRPSPSPSPLPRP